MKKVARSLRVFVTNIADSIISIPVVLFFSNFFSFRNTKGEAKKSTCWILANGPSLNNDILNINLNKREEFDLCVVNEFCFSEQFEALKPELYVIIDPAYWLKNHQVVEDVIERFYASLNGKVKWQMKLYVPFSGCRAVAKRITNATIKLVPFNNTPVKGFTFFEQFLYKYNLGVTQLQNVVVGAIYLGILMGYHKINLLGVDHDWHKNIHVDRDNHVVWANKHFYDTASNEDSYERIYSGEGYFDMQQIFHALSVTHQSYRKLALYAKNKKINISNYTAGSCIDVFERK